MLTMRYAYEESEMVVERANKMQAHALYVVGGFGYMQAKVVEQFYRVYEKSLIQIFISDFIRTII